MNTQKCHGAKTPNAYSEQSLRTLKTRLRKCYETLTAKAPAENIKTLLGRTAQMKTIEKMDVKEIRNKLGMNQSEFWAKIGVTQSGGSRYESGRNIPRPVQALLRLVHIEHVDIGKLKKDDWEVIEYLKSKNPSMLRELKKEAKTRIKTKAAR